MTRLLVVPLAALFAGGCVLVTEPISDVHKAEPDAKLVGKWVKTDSGPLDLVIDHPAVKGNPKGLMRVTTKSSDGQTSAVWFFCSTVEKKTYANCLGDRSSNGGTPPFETSGEFAKWEKSKTRGYVVMRYALSGDDLVLDVGEEKSVEKAFAAAGFEKEKGNYYRTPEGALAKYLATDADKVFTGQGKLAYKRAK
jgi:hypothetical protein